MQITFLGCPRPVGGANVEAGHTALLFRRMGFDVRVIAGSPEKPTNPWPARLAAAGCEVILDPAQLTLVQDSLCIAFCCEAAVRAWPTLRAHGCRLIYSPCMCSVMAYEREVLRTCPPTAVHFQSDFQVANLWPIYAKWGVLKSFRIHGAFDIEEFPFAPCRVGPKFVVAKLARAVTSKWPRDLWQILTEVRRKERVNLHAVCQGWRDELEADIGKPPHWAACYPEGTLATTDVLQHAHVLLCAGQADSENWPRVGLEAMASGVPVIADNRGGWLEMMGSTGILVNNHDDTVEALRCLASNSLRCELIAREARDRVEKLCEPSVLGAVWAGELTRI